MKMQICCTRKLYEKMKIKPEPDIQQDPLYSWHANLLTIRKFGKLVLLTNDENRYTLVLYGLKQKHFKKLDQYIAQALRETFKAEHLNSEVAEKYLEEAGEMVFTKTKNRSLVARMNQFCEWVYFRLDQIDKNTIVQPEVSLLLSHQLVSLNKKESDCPNYVFFKQLEELYDGDIRDHRAIELSVSLALEGEQVTRRIVVHPDITFFKLHLILQAVYGWLSYHLHTFLIYRPDTPEEEFKKSFGIPKEEFLPVMELVDSEEDMAYEDDTVKDKRLETGARLSDFLPAKILYIYDLGDSWHHYIEVVKTHKHYDGQIPACLAGKGDTPPEDVGGASGYHEFLKAYNDENHPEHEFYKNWALSLGYEAFSLEKANQRIKHDVIMRYESL